jgi:hypothetical protein
LLIRKVTLPFSLFYKEYRIQLIFFLFILSILFDIDKFVFWFVDL